MDVSRLRHCVRVPVLLMCLLIGGVVWAADTEPAQDAGIPCPSGQDDCIQAPAAPPDQPRPVLQGGALAHSVHALSARIDSFFANEKLYQDTTGSILRVNGDTIFNDAGEVGFEGKIKLRLKLPRTEKKLRLTLESDPEIERNTADTGFHGSPTTAVTKADYYAGLQWLADVGQGWQTGSSIGLKLDGGSPDYFLRLRLSKVIPLGGWTLRRDGSWFMYGQAGAGIDAAIEFDHLLADHWLFRSRSFVKYEIEPETSSPGQTFYIFHAMDNLRELVYELGVTGVDALNQSLTTDYLFAVRYRQAIHQDVVFIEAIPRVLFNQANGHDAEPQFVVRLEWLFRG